MDNVSSSKNENNSYGRKVSGVVTGIKVDFILQQLSLLFLLQSRTQAAGHGRTNLSCYMYYLVTCMFHPINVKVSK